LYHNLDRSANLPTGLYILLALITFFLFLFLMTSLSQIISVTTGPVFFTARRYAKRGICRRRVSVCVCLSHSGIVSKRLNVGSRRQR